MDTWGSSLVSGGAWYDENENENAQHLQNILEDEDAAKMGLTKENITLVDAYINVQYDGTKVPNQSSAIPTLPMLFSMP